MNEIINTINESPELMLEGAEKSEIQFDTSDKAFAELEKSVFTALETYSNVHRGSGHNSMVTTYLFDKAREIVLEYLGLKKGKHLVIFCTPRKAEMLKRLINSESYKTISSQEIGIPLGLCALAIKRGDLPKGVPFQTGGGTARLISHKWIIWEKAPDKFEAGTPAIINVIAFAKALLLIKKYGKNRFCKHMSAFI